MCKDTRHTMFSRKLKFIYYTQFTSNTDKNENAIYIKQVKNTHYLYFNVVTAPGFKPGFQHLHQVVNLPRAITKAQCWQRAHASCARLGIRGGRHSLFSTRPSSWVLQFWILNSFFFRIKFLTIRWFKVIQRFITQPLLRNKPVIYCQDLKTEIYY